MMKDDKGQRTNTKQGCSMNKNQDIKADGSISKGRITIIKDGPHIVEGHIPLDEQLMITEGNHREYRQGRTFEVNEKYALCRCGKSRTSPFCDGNHEKAAFQGSETASCKPFDERAEVLEGPTLDLLDDGRCAYARFCHREDGDVWTLTKRSGDKHLRDEAIKAACDCPTGRLVQRDKAAPYAELEPGFEPSISVLQDPDLSVSGPLYVKGYVPLIGTDGKQYESRNRYALCRCGASRNKPFCDASHVDAGFRDHPDDD